MSSCEALSTIWKGWVGRHFVLVFLDFLDLFLSLIFPMCLWSRHVHVCGVYACLWCHVWCVPLPIVPHEGV